MGGTANRQELLADTLATVASFTTVLADPNSGLVALLNKHYEKRLPK
jgi:hypothetical protein